MQLIQNVPQPPKCHKTEQPQLNGIHFPDGISHEPYHFSQKLCLTVMKPRLVRALFRADLILNVFIQPTIYSQPSLPVYTDVVGRAWDQQPWHFWLQDCRHAPFTFWICNILNMPNQSGTRTTQIWCLCVSVCVQIPLMGNLFGHCHTRSTCANLHQLKYKPGAVSVPDANLNIHHQVILLLFQYLYLCAADKEHRDWSWRVHFIYALIYTCKSSCQCKFLMNVSQWICIWNT